MAETSKIESYSYIETLKGKATYQQLENLFNILNDYDHSIECLMANRNYWNQQELDDKNEPLIPIQRV